MKASTQKLQTKLWLGPTSVEVEKKIRTNLRKKPWKKKFDEMSNEEVESLLSLVDGQRIPEEWFRQLFDQIRKRGIEY